MKKNGFTLIELLAAFALVSLILVLVFQVFTRQLDASKENVYQRQISTLKHLAKDYHLQNLTDNYVTIDTLVSKGLINSEELIDPRDGSTITGCIKFVMNEKYNQYEYTYEKNIENCN